MAYRWWVILRPQFLLYYFFTIILCDRLRLITCHFHMYLLFFIHYSPLAHKSNDKVLSLKVVVWDCFTKVLSLLVITKILKPGPNRTVRSKNPQTSQVCSFFNIKNRSMEKIRGTVWTVVRPYSFENRDQFLRFGLFFFFPDLEPLICKDI